MDAADKFGAMVMVDDAHGEGVLGRGGRGIVDHFELHGRVDIEVGTLSKAFGVVGGYVAGSAALIEYLRQRARPFLFSSATTAADVAACIAAVRILATDDSAVKKLWENTEYFQAEGARAGIRYRAHTDAHHADYRRRRAEGEGPLREALRGRRVRAGDSLSDRPAGQGAHKVHGLRVALERGPGFRG